MKVVAISDLHGFLPTNIDPSDIMLIAGDISPLSIQNNKLKMQEWLYTLFADWIISLPVNKVFMVAGNHDKYFQGLSSSQINELEAKCNFKLIYLEDTSTTYKFEGKEFKIFGTPYCHRFGNWSFMEDDNELKKRFKKIPEVVDIIISHDAPFVINNVDLFQQFRHVGNKPLAERLAEIKYTLLVCGHIHEGNHTFNSDSKVVNVSYLNDQYKPTYNPFYITLE
jgi:Icc-related predicted phosphoesterase